MPLINTLSQATDIDASNWDRLLGEQPLTSQAFVSALELDSNPGMASDWLPQHLLYQHDDQPGLLLPLYLKQQSYGEYVFDWSWAHASQQAGIGYYPKLVTALPFTPTCGPRLGRTHPTTIDQLPDLLDHLRQLATQQQCSSWHLLFAEHNDRVAIQQAWQDKQPLLERHDCQYHWLNREYRDFDDFLKQMNSRKRKQLRRERRKLIEQRVQFQRLTGDSIQPQHLLWFYQFYQQTYQVRGQRPYLSKPFFDRLHSRLADHLLLVLAERDGRCVGAALFLFDQHTLYGRWWGGDPSIDCLHFETCYYQGIDFAIEHKLQRFDPGTQGEHKLLRGFEPVRTTSLHWLRHPGLSNAVANWLNQERWQVDAYIEQARQHLPYRSAGTSPGTKKRALRPALDRSCLFNQR